MIKDEEFWAEIRKKKGDGNCLFKALLPTIHLCQARLAVSSTTVEILELRYRMMSEQFSLMAYGCTISKEESHNSVEAFNKKKAHLLSFYAGANERNALSMGKGVPPRFISEITIRVLQRILIFAVPIYSLRYKIFSMGLSTSCFSFIDRKGKCLTKYSRGTRSTFQSGANCRGCVAGDNFFGVLCDNDEVWVSGGLPVRDKTSVAPLGNPYEMYRIASQVLLLTASRTRLACLTRSFEALMLSASKDSGYSLCPFRHVRFLTMDYRTAVYLVGTDSVLYKADRSEGTITTPRRVLLFSQTPVSRVASGVGFVVVIDQYGRLLTSGKGKGGFFGAGKRLAVGISIFRVNYLSHHFFVQVVAGEYHCLALSSSGLCYACGSNTMGQLGIGKDISQTNTFTLVPLRGKCHGIAAGPQTSAFAMMDGKVYICGEVDNCVKDQSEVSSGSEGEPYRKRWYTPTTVEGLNMGVKWYNLDFSGKTKFTGIEPLAEPVPVSSTANNSVGDRLPVSEASVLSRDTTAPLSTNLHSDIEGVYAFSSSGSTMVSRQRRAASQREPFFIEQHENGAQEVRPQKVEKTFCSC